MTFFISVTGLIFAMPVVALMSLPVSVHVETITADQFAIRDALAGLAFIVTTPSLTAS